MGLVLDTMAKRFLELAAEEGMEESLSYLVEKLEEARLMPLEIPQTETASGRKIRVRPDVMVDALIADNPALREAISVAAIRPHPHSETVESLVLSLVPSPER